MTAPRCRRLQTCAPSLILREAERAQRPRILAANMKASSACLAGQRHFQYVELPEMIEMLRVRLRDVCYRSC